MVFQVGLNQGRGTNHDPDGPPDNPLERAMQDKESPRRLFVLRAAGWVSTPLCYLLMMSVVIAATRRLPARNWLKRA
jgi:hypothetical protein